MKLTKDLFQDGMSVRLRVSTSFHARYGLRLVVEDLDPTHTIGALEQRRQRTLERLAAANLLDRNAQQTMPMVPHRLAVISSETAAGLADFNRQLANNQYGYAFKTSMFSAAMQGRQTGPEIMTRLRQIARRRTDYDAVIIVRGGGGRMDLAAFDDEDLAVAVAEFPRPVIVGIGHETDVSVLDSVAYQSLKTPTAAAVYLLELGAQVEYEILQLGRSIEYAGRTILAREAPRLDRYMELSHRLANNVLQTEKSRLDRITSELPIIAQRSLQSAEQRLDHLGQLLTALRPETTLARGYALINQEGRLITRPEDVEAGEVEVQLKEGRLKLRKE
ncbi:MAG: exodeoxyribonuclease VII large subunit [Bacteroidota bacterium]